MKPFLRAEWLYLANITYAVDPSVLSAYLPRGLELDIVNGKAFVGLLPFSFNNTRIRSLPCSLPHKLPGDEPSLLR